MNRPLRLRCSSTGSRNPSSQGAKEGEAKFCLGYIRRAWRVEGRREGARGGEGRGGEKRGRREKEREQEQQIGR